MSSNADSGRVWSPMPQMPCRPAHNPWSAAKTTTVRESKPFFRSVSSTRPTPSSTPLTSAAYRRMAPKSFSSGLFPRSHGCIFSRGNERSSAPAYSSA